MQESLEAAAIYSCVPPMSLRHSFDTRGLGVSSCYELLRNDWEKVFQFPERKPLEGFGDCASRDRTAAHWEIQSISNARYCSLPFRSTWRTTASPALSGRTVS